MKHIKEFIKPKEIDTKEFNESYTLLDYIFDTYVHKLEDFNKNIEIEESSYALFTKYFDLLIDKTMEKYNIFFETRADRTSNNYYIRFRYTYKE